MAALVAPAAPAALVQAVFGALNGVGVQAVLAESGCRAGVPGSQTILQQRAEGMGQ